MDRLYQQRGSNAFYVCFGTVSPFGPFGRLGVGWVTMLFIFILAVLERLWECIDIVETGSIIAF